MVPALDLLLDIVRQNGDELLAEMLRRHLSSVFRLGLQPFPYVCIQVANVLALGGGIAGTYAFRA